jgi:predicted site-specific integrase-resolvase
MKECYAWQMSKPVVSYIRVSTARQGSSELGLEAQRESVRVFALANGYEVAKEFLEIESGKNDARPVLAEALAYAKKTGACLVIAKLDRLARSVSFLSCSVENSCSCPIAVGTSIAACPPHGSRRAQLTHRALTASNWR